VWTINDYTTKKAGYLSLMKDGQRVCDFFPFARDADAAWVREQARLIAERMNEIKNGENRAGDGPEPA
jgi:Fe-S cluster biosynthesis and repair protein YggX